jgi:hypothetical protein
MTWQAHAFLKRTKETAKGFVTVAISGKPSRYSAPFAVAAPGNG